MDRELVDASAYAPGRRYVYIHQFTRWQHFSAWNDITAAILSDITQEIRLCQLMHIYLKNHLPNFTWIWSDGALGFVENTSPQ